MSYLLVENEPTVELSGYLDSNGRLDLSHADGNLNDNSNTLEAADPGTNIRIKLMDFNDGSSSWAIDASHEGVTAPITWNRGADHAYYDFPDYMSNFLKVDVTASDGTAAKEKIIDVRTKPEGSLPDEL